MRSYTASRHRKRRRSRWITPCGIELSPSGGSGWLTIWAVKKALSWLTALDSSEGCCPFISRRKVDSSRVSLWNRPSPSPVMSPKVSVTRKVSPSFSTNRR